MFYPVTNIFDHICACDVCDECNFHMAQFIVLSIDINLDINLNKTDNLQHQIITIIRVHPLTTNRLWPYFQFVYNIRNHTQRRPIPIPDPSHKTRRLPHRLKRKNCWWPQGQDEAPQEIRNSNPQRWRLDGIVDLLSACCCSQVDLGEMR